MSLLLVLLGLTVAAVLWPLVAGPIALRKKFWRSRDTPIQNIPEDEAEEAVVLLVQAARPQLEPLGYIFVGYGRLVHITPETTGDLGFFWHPRDNIAIEVDGSINEDGIAILHTVVNATGSTGEDLMVSNAEILLSPTSRKRTAYYFPDIKDVAKLHAIFHWLLSKRPDLQPLEPLPAGQEFLAMQQETAKALAMEAQAGRYMLDAAREKYLLTWKGAVLFTLAYVFPGKQIREYWAQRRANRALAQMASDPLSSVRVLAQDIRRTEQFHPQTDHNQKEEVAWLKAQIAAFERKQAKDMPSSQYGWPTKAGLLLVSMLVSALSFGLSFSWQTVSILVGVLFLHELGHYLGMVMCGYRDPKILFLPFLGAATIGQKEDATPLQQLLVFMLGPLPGLLLGLWCLFAANDASIWFEVGIFAFVLNYLNLLPITPLDGGHIVKILLLNRFPRMQTVFYAGSTGLLAFGAWWFSDVVLSVLSGLLVCNLPEQWRLGRAARLLIQTGEPPQDTHTRVETVFSLLSVPEWKKQTHTDRCELVATLLQWWEAKKPSWQLMSFGTGLYVVSLLVPLWSGVAPFLPWASASSIVSEPCAEYAAQRKALPAQDILNSREASSQQIAKQIGDRLHIKLICLSSMSDAERTYLDVRQDLFHFEFDLELGGFQRFFHENGEDFGQVRAALQRIGVVHVDDLLTQASGVFPDQNVPETYQAIEEALQIIDVEEENPARLRWEELDREYWAYYQDEIAQRLVDFVRAHEDEFE